LLALAIAFLSLASPLNSPALGKRVSFITRAAPASRVLPELGKVARLNIRATPETANEGLIIKVDDVPVGEVLKRIAVVTSGKWEHRSEAYWLVPDKTVREREQSAEFDRRLVTARKVVSEHTKIGDPDGILWRSVAPISIAQLQPDEAVVFSTKPTTWQKPFLDGVLPKINEFVRSRNHLVQTFVGGSAASTHGIDGRGQIETRKVGKIVKALLTVRRSPFAEFQDQVTFAVYLVDTDGKVAYMNGDGAEYTGSIPFYPYDESDDSWPHPPKAGPAIHFEPSSIVFLTGMSDLRDKLLHPSISDPLSFFQTDELLAYGKLSGKPFVADVPDRWPKTGFHHGYEPTAASVEDIVMSGSYVKKLDDPTFSLLKPSRPVEDRAERVNRSALEKLVEQSSRERFPTVQQVCQFAYHSGRPTTLQTLDDYLQMFIPPLSEFFGNADWALLLSVGSTR